MRCDERLDLRGLRWSTATAMPSPPAAVDELGGLLDRLGPVVLRAPLPGRAAGAVDRRARLAQRDGGAAPGAAGRARHERHLAGQRSRHGGHPRRRLGGRRREDAAGARTASTASEHERAAGELHGAERLAEDDERQRRR